MISFLPDVFIIVLSFALFGYLHSLLASDTIKKWFVKKFGNLIALYRLAYNLLSVIILYFMYWHLPRPDYKIYDLSAPYDLIVLIPQFLGIAGFVWTLRYVCIKEFMGINQVVRLFNGTYNPDELDEHMSLRIEGPYRYMRHPIYFFAIVILLFRPVMDLFYLTSLLCIIAYFYIGSFYEERKLTIKFGKEYIDYKKEVPAIIPYKIFKPYKVTHY